MSSGAYSLADLDDSPQQKGKYGPDDLEESPPAPPKKYLPEVNKAVASVPRPDSPLNYAEPSNDVTGAVTGFFPTRTPKNGPRAQLPAPSAGAMTKAILSSPLGQSESELIPGAGTEISAAQHLATSGKRWQGATEAVQGAGEAVSPFMGPAAVEMSAAPALIPALKFGAGLGAGMIAQPAAEKVSGKLGAGPEQQKFWGELAFWAPATAGLLSGARAESVAGGKGASVTAFGDRAGVSVAPTPEGGVAVRGKIGPFERTKVFGGRTPAGPAIEPPTIDATPPDPATEALVKSQQIDQAATRAVNGQPPVAPPPPPPSVTDQPGAPPELKQGVISQKLVDSFAGVVAALPETMRGQAIQEAHARLSQVITEGSKFGPMVGPDGKLLQAKDPADASKQAMDLINSAIDAHEKASAKTQGEGAGGKGAASVPAEAAPPKPGRSRMKAAELAKPTGKYSTDDLAEPADALPARSEALGTPKGQEGENVAVAAKEPLTEGVQSNHELERKGGTGATERPANLPGEPESIPNEVGRSAATSSGTTASGGGNLNRGSEEAVSGTGEGTRPLRKGDSAVLSRDTVVDNRTIAEGSRVTIRYVHPNGLLARAETDDGIKFSRGIGSFSRSRNAMDAGASSGASRENKGHLDTRTSPSSGRSLTPDIGQNNPHTGSQKEGGVGKPSPITRESNDGRKVLVRENGNGAEVGASRPHGKEVRSETVEERARSSQEPRRLGQSGRESGSPHGNGTSKEALPAADAGAVVPQAREMPEMRNDESAAQGQRAVPKLPSAGLVSQEQRGSAGTKESPASSETEAATKYKFGNTQAPIHPDSEAAKSLESARARISESDLAGKGRDIGDGGNHVTVRYGIQDDETGGIKKFLSQQPPFEATLGKTDSFPPSEHSDGAAPIIAPVNAPDLHRLNAELEKHGNFTEPSFKEFKPHATIGYVAPEKASRYTGMSVTEGKKFTVDRVAITDRNGGAEIVKLEGQPAPRKEAPTYKAGNPFADRATAARAKSNGLNKPTAHDAAMEKAFPLGAGFGRPGATKRVDASVNRAVSAVEAKKNADYLEAQAAAFDRGEINAQGRRITAESQARSEKREAYLGKREERVAKAKAELEGKERWQVPAEVYADSTNNLGGGARELMLGDHRESVEKAIADGKTVPAEVLKDYPDLRDQQIKKYLKSKGHNDEYIANYLADKNKSVETEKVEPVVAAKPVEKMAEKWKKGEVVTFTKIPPGSYLRPNEPYLVEHVGKTAIEFRNPRTGGKTGDTPSMLTHAEYTKEPAVTAAPKPSKVKSVELVVAEVAKPETARPESLKTAAEAGRDAGVASRRGDRSLAQDIMAGNAKYLNGQPEGVRKEILAAFNKAYHAEADKPVEQPARVKVPTKTEVTELEREYGATSSRSTNPDVDLAVGRARQRWQDAKKAYDDAQKPKRLASEVKAANEFKTAADRVGKDDSAASILDKMRNQASWNRLKILERVSKEQAQAILDTKSEDRPISLESGEVQLLKDKAGVKEPGLEDRARVAIATGKAEKIEPEETVPEAGKNFEGRYVRAALEPVKEAWAGMMKNGDPSEENWKWMVKQGIGDNEASRPTEYKKGHLYIKVPDDGSFYIPNTPAAIDHALKAAGKFTESQASQSLPKVGAKKFRVNSPKEFDTEKYIVGLEKEVADLEDKARSETGGRYDHIQDQLKAARENLAEAKKQTPESILTGESGEFNPGQLVDTALEATGAVGEYLRDAAHYTHIARDLQRDLETLDTRKQALVLNAVKTFQKLKKEGLTKEDDEKLYHFIENPETENLGAKQEDWLDQGTPLLDTNAELYTELTQGGVPIENYVHRVVKGKGGVLDRIAQGVKGIGQKATLSKSAPQTKSRTYMALENQNGERQVVSIKGGQVTGWNNGTSENLGGISHTQEGNVFEDKDGNIWNLKQATTKEIEKHTETRYYHSFFASTLVSNIQLQSAVNAMRFLNEFKASPEFKETAFDLTKGNPPKGWQSTNLMQFKGYAFEPRTAEVLDAYYDRMRQGNLGALDQVGKFMRVAMLLNPIRHPINVAMSWSMERGASGFLMPSRIKNTWTTGNRAIKAVISKNQDYIDGLEAGGALQSHREMMSDIHHLFYDQLSEGLGKEEPWAMKVAKALGIEHGNLLNILHKFSSTVAWASGDIGMLQSAYQYQVEHPGTALTDAFKEVGRINPEYRVPTRIADSPMLSKLMKNKWATIFGAYHYSLLRSFGEVAKSALGAQEPAPGRTKAEEVAKAWDRLALLALGIVLMSAVGDELAKRLTHDKHARMLRAGPFGVIDSVASVMRHEQSAGNAIQRVVTPAPQTKAAAELAFDREFYSGHAIYDPHASFKTQGEQIGRYLLGETTGQIGQYEKAQTTEQKKRFAWGQVGVQFHKTAAEKTAADIAMSKVGTQAEDPEDQKNRVLRREILDQLRTGNSKPLRDAEGKREITPRQAKALEHRAHLTPLQDTIHGFTYAEARKVYEVASPEEKKELDPIMRQKRINLFKAGRGKEATSATP